jgi:hypothetical protein
MSDQPNTPAVAAFSHWPSYDSLNEQYLCIVEEGMPGFIAFASTIVFRQNLAGTTCQKADADALLATFQALGYKGAAKVEVFSDSVYQVQYPDPNRQEYIFVDANGNYDGLIKGYLRDQAVYNVFNGGGVGNSGSWMLPAGAAEPVWTPTSYVAPVAAA